MPLLQNHLIIPRQRQDVPGHGGDPAPQVHPRVHIGGVCLHVLEADRLDRASLEELLVVCQVAHMIHFDLGRVVAGETVVVFHHCDGQMLDVRQVLDQGQP